MFNRSDSVKIDSGVRRIVLTLNGSANNARKRQPYLDAVGEVFAVPS
jgi:hypothetical protein